MVSIAWARATWRNGAYIFRTLPIVGLGSAGRETCHHTARRTLDETCFGSGRSLSPLSVSIALGLVNGKLMLIGNVMASSCHTILPFHRELEREKLWSRIHLVPLLMAEGDRDQYRRQQAALAREKEIMKDVPGWEVRNFSSPPVSCSCDSMLMIITITIRPCRPGLLSATTFIMHVSWGSGWQERVQEPQVRAEQYCTGMTCVCLWPMNITCLECPTRHESANIHARTRVPASYPSRSGAALGPKSWDRKAERGKAGKGRSCGQKAGAYIGMDLGRWI